MFQAFQRGAVARRQVSLAVLALVMATAGAVPLQAQSVEPESAAPRMCAVFAGETSAEGLQAIHAACWGTGLVLGEAEQFESHTNVELGAVVVRLVRADRTRVLLLRSRPDGLPMVENLASDIASAAGRGPIGGIDGLTLDFAGFASGGVIDVAETGSAEPAMQMQRQVVSGEATTPAANRIDIAAMIAADPAVASAEQVAQ